MANMLRMSFRGSTGSSKGKHGLAFAISSHAGLKHFVLCQIDFTPEQIGQPIF
jgi:hypothetical protein